MAQQLVSHAYDHERAAERLCGIGYRQSQAQRPLPDGRTEVHIRIDLDSTLPTDRIPISFSLEVKHEIEDLRSALEYVAKELQARLTTHYQRRRAGFPVVRGQPEFVRFVEERFPGIDRLFPATREVLESCQDYRLASQKVAFDSGPWLGDLNRLWNESKHSALTYHSYRPTDFYLAADVGAQITEQSGNRLYFDLVGRSVFELLLRCRTGVEDVLGRIPTTVGWTPDEDVDRLLAKHIGNRERSAEDDA
ncbi:MAG: hypothetical protein L3J97_00575 [Thermoplasmata archaeon]|nr:hypothetical protein [Thermoplasmata archaeon]